MYLCHALVLLPCCRRAPDGMVLSLVVPFAAGKLLIDEVMDEIVLGQSSVGFRPSEAPRRFKQKAISIAQASLRLCPDVVEIRHFAFEWWPINHLRCWKRLCCIQDLTVSR